MEYATADKRIVNAIGNAAAILLKTKAHKATKYLSPNMIVRATRTLSRGRVDSRGNGDIRITIGKPNFAERAFVKTLQKAGEPFPVKKIVLKYPPQKKK